jgi:hypothetical protein
MNINPADVLQVQVEKVAEDQFLLILQWVESAITVY